MAESIRNFTIEKCGDCKCMDHTGYCVSRREQRDKHCPACGWAESFSGDALTVAKRIWAELEFATVEDDGDTIDVDVRIPVLGWYYAHEADRHEIWHDIEELTGVSVAYLMGFAKNPDGTN